MPPEFSAQSKQRIERVLSRYPNKQAALLPVLHIAQDEFGHLPDPVIELCAKTCEVSPAHVFGVVTFYTMFHRARHGRNELMVCTNISCMLRGGYEILHHIEQKLGTKPGQTTPDGAFTLVEEECLAACANAPMMFCGQDYLLDQRECAVGRGLAGLDAQLLLDVVQDLVPAAQHARDVRAHHQIGRAHV